MEQERISEGAGSGPLFKSFWQAGFECSTHRRRDGKRLDLLSQTRHDELAVEDFRRLASFGIKTVRTGARWHLVEAHERDYSFDSLLATIKAAEETGVQVLLDLMHFGWPDDLDIFSAEFPRRFGLYTRALIRFLKPYRHLIGAFAPVNEISFLAWAGGEAAFLNPHQSGRADELKRILVTAAAISSEILLNEWLNCRLISPEPVVHIVGDQSLPGSEQHAAAFSAAQYQAWDMLSGRSHPELGGRPEYLDIVGLNFYEQNQWAISGERVVRSDFRYKPFRGILREVFEKYGRPMFVSETGAEDDNRADWFNYVCGEVKAACGAGVCIHGICLYPILNHPGWDDDRHCCNGLFDYADGNGDREIHKPLARALRDRQFELDRHFARDRNPLSFEALTQRAPSFKLPEQRVGEFLS